MQTIDLEFLSQNILVLSETNEWKWLNALEGKAILLSHYKNLSVIHLLSKNTQEAREEIRKLPGVIAVQRDYPVYPLKAKPKEKNIFREIQSLHDESETTPATSARTPVAGASPNCTLEETCNKNTAKYWAYDAVDADLMHYKMQSIGINETHTANVAVVDSGFDRAQANQFDVIGQVMSFAGAEFKQKHPITGKELPGYSKDYFIGDPNKDESGHGTMVASTIGGKGKLGIAKNISLSVYRVTKPGSTGSTSSAMLESSIYRACEENRDSNGLTVINVSWGGRFDESGIKPEEEDEVTKKLIEKFTEMGCLIVKAAGNDNFRHERNYDLDDPYLRVAAIDTTRGLSYFSTLGEVSAPGSSIYVLESTTASDKAKPEKRCNGSDAGVNPKRLVNGTSFAAPIGAAIASQVIRVLKAKEAFKHLTPKDRIRLVNRIISASQFQNAMNGLRAVTIAYRWNELSEEERGKAFEKDGVKFLGSLLNGKDEKVCQSKSERCLGKNACDHLIACTSLNRAKILLCPEHEDFLSEDLAASAFKYKAFNLGYRYSQLALEHTQDEKKKNQIRYNAFKNFKESIQIPSDPNDLERYWKFPPEIDPNLIKSAVLPYLSQVPIQTKTDAGNYYQNIVKLILYSPDVMRSLEFGVDPVTGEDRGSNETYRLVKETLKEARRFLPPNRYANFIDDYVTWFNRRLDSNLEFINKYDFSENFLPTPLSVSAVRILNAAIENEPKDSPLLPRLIEAERRILRKMSELNQFHGRQTMGASLFSEIYPTRSTLDSLFNRHTDLLFEAYNDNLLHTLSPAQIEHAIDHVDDLGIFKDKTDFLLKALEVVSTKQGFGPANDKDITHSALLKLHLLWPSLSAEKQKETQEKFHKLMEKAQNLNFVTEVLNSWIDDAIYLKPRLDVLFGIADDKKEKEQGLSFKKNPLLTRTEIDLLAVKMSSFLLDAKAEDAEKLKYSTVEIYAAGYALRGIWSKQLPANVNFVSPVIPPKGTTRLKSEQPKVFERNLSNRDQYFSDFLETLFTKLEDPKTSSLYSSVLEHGFIPGNYDLRYDKDTRLSIASIPVEGKWRDTAERLKKKNNTSFNFMINKLLQSIVEAQKPTP